MHDIGALAWGRFMFLRNSWYVAAWDREIGRQPLARMILGEPIVLYRQEDGRPVALEDRCCHRHLPLSLGQLEGDTLRCGYHGLRFDAGGRCIEIPSQAQIPPDAAIRSYPLVERFNWVWIWMGDPKRADLVYVYASSIGNPSINDFPATTERDGNRVRLTRWIIDRPAPPMYQAAGQFAGNVDRWQIVEHRPPCFSVNFAGCAATGTGAPQGERSHGIELMALSAPTPETERTTHYFFQFPRKFGLGDAALDKVFNTDFVDVFREDVAVL